MSSSEAVRLQDKGSPAISPTISYMRFLRTLWSLFSKRERLHLGLLLAGMTVGAALEALGVGLLVPLISAMGNPSLIHDNRLFQRFYDWIGARGIEDFLLRISLLMLAVYLIKNVYLGMLAYLQALFIYRKQTQISGNLLTYYLRQPYTFHLQQNSADLQFNTTGVVANVTGGVLTPLLMVLSETLILLVILGALFAVEPQATIVAVLVVAMLAFAYQRFFKDILTRHGRGSGTAAKGMQRTVREALGSIKEVKVSGRENLFVSAFRKDGFSFVRSAGVFAALNAIPRLLTEMLVVGGLLLAVIALVMQPGALERAFPLLALVGAAALRVMPSFTRISGALTGIRFNIGYVDTLSLSTLQASADLGEPPRDEQTLPPFKCLELREVEHQYADSKAPSLISVCMTIRRGEYIGIIGSTGAGKTTLVNIILGLLEPSRGEVLIGAYELPKVRNQWQRNIGYVPQSIYLLDNSVRRNVAFGFAEGDIRDADVWAALDAARVGTLVRSLPNQLDTIVGDNGVRLSGGERQRIGIARALFTRPEVIIFDEATSSLDNQTEREINETISNLGGERTVIAVTHRLTAVTKCDRVYLVGSGRILDYGSYEELLSRSDILRRMDNSGPPNQ
jgi:ATP-binding cassette, subfamily B, bacterial PglK